MNRRWIELSAAALVACATPREAARPEPVPIDPPLEVERVFAGAIPIDADAAATAFREAHLRVLTGEPFRLVALRLDGACRSVRDGPGLARRGARPSPGDTLEIGEAPGSDFRVGPAVTCPVPYDAPPWQSVLFYEAGGVLRAIHFQFVTVGPDRLDASTLRNDAPRVVPAAAAAR